MSENQHKIAWRDGIPVSLQFDDPFFSLSDGLAETVHVFLAGNGLPERFRDGFHIAETGFGTGLNFLAALASFRACGCGGVLHFTSFEAFPMAPQDQRTALARYPALPLDALSAPQGPDYRLTLIEGDARRTLPLWAGAADAWFLDGFAPARNPEMWEAPLLAEVARHTRPNGSVATYTAAGAVRRALADAGFEVERVAGHGAKRHMTRGHLR